MLLAFLLVVWLAWAVACAAQVAASDARRGIPRNQRRGASILPGFPLFPLVFWGLALLIDRFIDPWGTRAIAALHVVLLGMWVISVERARRVLARHEDTA